jgi:hypothetical protein
MKYNEMVLWLSMTSPIKRSLLATATALVLFGCSSPAGSTTLEQAVARVEQDQTPAAVEEAARRQFADLQSNNLGKVFAAYTKLCQLEIGEKNFAVQSSLERLMIEKATGSKMSDLELRDVSVVDFTPERAAVTAHIHLQDGTLFANAEPTPVVMLYEEGQWRSDNCRHSG